MRSRSSGEVKFSDSTGISTISNLNFSAGNISISNSPWFYKDHEYRKPITISRNIDPWWNSSFLYRTPITINNTAGNLTNYQVYINLTSSKVGSNFNWSKDGNDTRFIYYNSTSGIHNNLDYWIESWNSTANTSIIWVNVTSLINNTNTTVYMYYGNPSATSASNGTNTFEFFDDFEGTSLDATKWYTVSSGTGGISVSGGILTLSGDGTTSAEISTQNPIVGNKINEWRLKTSSNIQTFGFVATKTGSIYASGYGTVYNRDIAPFRIYQDVSQWGTANGLFSESEDSLYHDWRMIYTNIIRFYLDNSLKATGADAVSLNHYLHFGAYSATASKLYIDNVRVRKYASPEPTASFGAEQPYSLTDYQVAINLTTAIYNNTGLVGSWHFSEGSGNRTADSSGFGNDGTMYGGMNTTLDANLTSGWVSAGKFGNALRFDGTDDYVNVANRNSLNFGTGDLTMAGWAYPTSAHSDWDPVLSLSNNYAVGFKGSGSYFYDGTSFAITGAGVTLNNWHYVVLTRKSGVATLYIDSSVIGTNADTSSQSGKSFNIGGDGGSYFNGTIDEVRIYNRSLSATEIQEQYQAGKARLDYQNLRFTWVNSSTTNSFDNRTQVLAREEIADYTLIPNPDRSSTRSLVENTLTLFCCLNANSSDQSDELNANANAKYGSSLVCSSCGEILFASDKNPSYTSPGKDSIFLSSNENKNANPSSLTLPNFFILSPLSANSSKANSGEINLQPRFVNSSITLLLSESRLKNENKTQASTIRILGNFSNICTPYNLCLLAISSLSSEPHFNANSSVILEFFSNSSATLNINLSDNLSFNALHTTEFISSLLSSLNPGFNPSGISTTNSAIPITSDNNAQENYLNLPDCSEISNGYCQEEGKFYKQEWKFFSELNGNEQVATLKTEDKRPEDPTT